MRLRTFPIYFFAIWVVVKYYVNFPLGFLSYCFSGDHIFCMSSSLALGIIHIFLRLWVQKSLLRGSLKCQDRWDKVLTSVFWSLMYLWHLAHSKNPGNLMNDCWMRQRRFTQLAWPVTPTPRGKQQEGLGEAHFLPVQPAGTLGEEGISAFSTKRAEIATVCEVRNTDVGGKGHRGKDRN